MRQMERLLVLAKRPTVLGIPERSLLLSDVAKRNTTYSSTTFYTGVTGRLVVVLGIRYSLRPVYKHSYHSNSRNISGRKLRMCPHRHPLLPRSLRLPLSLRLSPGRHLSPLSPPSPQSNRPTAPTPPPGARHAPPHRSSRARARPRGGDPVVGRRSLSTFGAGMASISRAGQGN